MKTRFSFLLLIFHLLAFSGTAQTLIINEVSNGPTGNQEYVEFVVVSDAAVYDCANTIPPCIDIRGWIFDDNSGYHGTSGIATGAVRFSQDPLWSCIPLGTIILIYNDADRYAGIPTDDLSMADGNCSIIAPMNSPLFETNGTTPGASACSYPATGWVSGGNWINTVFANSGDCARIVNLAGCEVFSLCWGSDNQNNLIYFSGSGSQKVWYFNDGDPAIQANWTSAASNPAPGGQTPGAPNNAANAAYIAQFNNGCLPITPITVAATSLPATCTCDGSASAIADGSIGPYTYEWFDAVMSPIGQSTATATGLCAGDYIVEATSSIGCTETTTITVASGVGGGTILPTFANIPNVCIGDAEPILPTSSTNTPAITGVWSPAVSTSAAGTTVYTFTPDAGQCATTTTLSITVDPLITPTFAAVSDLCINASAPVLPTSSTNGTPIIGTWAPAVSTATAGSSVYTFTPNSGQCATTTTTTILVTSSITPTFTAVAPLCQNSAAPTLPTSSTNTPSIIGSWSPAVSTATLGSATYTFTADPGQCAGNTTMTILTTTPVTPTFSAVPSVCQATTPPVFPTSSLETPPITGTWSPAVSTSSAGTSTYTFTVAAGQCATNTTMNFTVDAPILPTFASIANLCEGSTPPVLPLSSTNVPPIPGTWSSVVNTATAGTSSYTFTPNAGQCATTTNISITIDPLITPTFTSIPNLCEGSTPPILPLNSTNTPPIAGSWSSPVNTATAGTSSYTFTPNAGQCATTANISITVDPLLTPTFSAIPNLCVGSTPPVLPSNSTNNPPIAGTWSSIVNTASAGTTAYTFTPTSGQCAAIASISITVNPLPVVDAGMPQAICAGGGPVILNGAGAMSYTWNNGVTNNLPFSPTSTLTYTVTGTDNNGCENTDNVVVTVNPLPLVNAGTDQTICEGASVTFSGAGAGSYSWTGGIVDNSAFTPLAGTSTYTLTGTDVNNCSNTDQVILTVHANPIVDAGVDQAVCLSNGTVISATGALSYFWDNGLGLGNDFTVNPSVMTTYTVIGTDAFGCIGIDQTIISVGTAPVADAGEDQMICIGEPLTLFVAGSDTYTWDHGIVNGLAFVPSVGTHTYTLTVLNGTGCTSTDQVLVTVNPYPIADFVANPSLLTTTSPESTMINQSIGASTYQWYFTDGGSSQLTNPSFVFTDSSESEHLIVLIAISEAGCSDTAVREISFSEELIYYVPNTFTPDENGRNDVFLPVFTSGFDIYSYSLKIFNRWGELIFESYDASKGWDGSYGDREEGVQDGTYTWKIEFKIIGYDKRIREVGHINLLR